MPGDAEFTAKVPFTQDPEFIKLERDIQLRQAQESKALEKKQMEQRTAFGKQPGVTRQQLDEQYQKQLQEREAQSKNFKKEHDRYVKEYHDAKVLGAEIEQRDRERALSPDNAPKKTR